MVNHLRCFTFLCVILALLSFPCRLRVDHQLQEVNPLLQELRTMVILKDIMNM